MSARDRIARLTRPAPSPAQGDDDAHAHVPAHAHAFVQLQTQRMVRLHCHIEDNQMAYLNRVSQEQGIDKAVLVRHILEYYREHGPLKEI